MSGFDRTGGQRGNQDLGDWSGYAIKGKEFEVLLYVLSCC